MAFTTQPPIVASLFLLNGAAASASRSDRIGRKSLLRVFVVKDPLQAATILRCKKCKKYEMDRDRQDEDDASSANKSNLH
jgi:hypothetical protein